LPHISLTQAVSANTGLADKQAVAPNPILYLQMQQKACENSTMALKSYLELAAEISPSKVCRIMMR
jgi:hypothetical protein